MLGNTAMDELAAARVIVFGLGGVGSWCAEALVRSGVGNVTIVDNDTVCVTNINRQVQATPKTVGQQKAPSLRDRLLEINPSCKVTALTEVFDAASAENFAIETYNYCIDAIDSLSCKLDLIEICFKKNVKLFSSMGMAQKLDPTRLRSADIWETKGCALARLVRHGLRQRNFAGSFLCVYSEEALPRVDGVEVSCGTGRCLCPKGCAESSVDWCASKKVINGSSVTVTASAGFALASLVLQDVASKVSSHE
jgi:tRNA A37 threonylcarbamoyladenosine dehydratase